MNHHPSQKETSSTTYYCVYCGENNHTFVDPSGGSTQEYIEDCQVCCRPNKLIVNYDKWSEEFIIRACQSQ